MFDHSKAFGARKGGTKRTWRAVSPPQRHSATMSPRALATLDPEHVSCCCVSNPFARSHTAHAGPQGTSVCDPLPDYRNGSLCERVRVHQVPFQSEPEGFMERCPECCFMEMGMVEVWGWSWLLSARAVHGCFGGAAFPCGVPKAWTWAYEVLSGFRHFDKEKKKRFTFAIQFGLLHTSQAKLQVHGAACPELAFGFAPAPPLPLTHGTPLPLRRPP